MSLILESLSLQVIFIMEVVIKMIALGAFCDYVPWKFFSFKHLWVWPFLAVWRSFEQGSKGLRILREMGAKHTCGASRMFWTSSL